jgi:hypothetical protein
MLSDIVARGQGVGRVVIGEYLYSVLSMSSSVLKLYALSIGFRKLGEAVLHPIRLD